MTTAIDTADDQANLVCSARRCRNDPAWALRWHNPRLHAPDYRKVWLACPEHLESLSDFLSARGFGLEVVSIEERDGG